MRIVDVLAMLQGGTSPAAIVDDFPYLTEPDVREVLAYATATNRPVVTGAPWLDPSDDAPEWTDEMLDIAKFAIGGKVIRPARGYLGPNGVVMGRPPLRERANQLVTLRLDPDVLAKFREGGPGWQGRINAALRAAAGL